MEKKIKKVAVLGAGVMGAQIAGHLANAGIPSYLFDMNKELAEKGKAILMISSELPEILGMSDRVLVMNEGHITGEISNPREATQQDVMILATKSKSMAS